jgi:hypothetical protein
MVLSRRLRPSRRSGGPRPSQLLPLTSLLLLLGATVSSGRVALVPHDGLHPLGLMEAFLPLQLAALAYGWVRRA